MPLFTAAPLRSPASSPASGSTPEPRLRAREEITPDLGLLELLAERALGREALRGAVDIPALVQHLSDSLRRELDFLQEAEHIERMHEMLVPYTRLAVPGLHRDLST